MVYSIGEVAAKFNLSVSQLRYYDQIGLFPDIQRDHAGHRQFEDHDVDLVAQIVSLKRANVSLPAITDFLRLYQAGTATLPQRAEILDDQAASLQEQMDRLKETQVYVQFKQWDYDQALATGRDIAVVPADHETFEAAFMATLEASGDADGQAAFRRLQARYPAGLCVVAFSEVVAP